MRKKERSEFLFLLSLFLFPSFPFPPSSTFCDSEKKEHIIKARWAKAKKNEPMMKRTCFFGIINISPIMLITRENRVCLEDGEDLHLSGQLWRYSMKHRRGMGLMRSSFVLSPIQIVHKNQIWWKNASNIALILPFLPCFGSLYVSSDAPFSSSIN